MSEPKQNPEGLLLRSAPKPVRRLNRRVLIVGSGVLGAGVLAITLWSLQPRSQSPATPWTAAPQTQANRLARAEGLESLPRDYGSVPPLGPPLGELGRPILRAQRDAGLGGLDSGTSFAPDFTADDERGRRLKYAQDDQAAAKAQVFFQLSGRKREKSEVIAPPQELSVLDRALSMVPQGVANSGTPVASEDGPTDSNRQSSKRAFAGEAAAADAHSESELELLRSPYELLAGTVIPAALITGINSDLPGMVTASVTENVYDTVTGRHLLIPQGSRLLGRYDSDVTFGQRRVLLVWTRLLRPDGSSITLDRLPGVDAAGYAGLADRVDFHWRRIFAGAAVSSLIGVGAELASPSRQNNGNAVVLAARDGLESSITDVGQQITQRNLDLQPTLTVRPGFPLRVIIKVDITLSPFKGIVGRSR